jgi:nucleoside-diphosphate-sugar epimerase
MVNLLSLSDAARAIALAASSNATGVFNIPGCDTLPLSELIHRSGRFGLALPGPLLAPLYGLRAVVTPRHFRYGSDRKRFHYGTVLDGRKASRALGYVPESRLAFEGASELSAA